MATEEENNESKRRRSVESDVISIASVDSDTKLEGEEPDVRLVVLGGKSVGKSAISVRFMTRRYIGEYQPCTEHIYGRKIMFGNDIIKYELKDTADLRDCNSHIEWASCIAIVYSIDDRSSFNKANNILRNIVTYLENKDQSSRSLSYALIANKNDLDHLRVVKSEEGKTMARSFNAGFWEMSAADDYQSTYGPLSAMLIESYFSSGQTPINPVQQSYKKCSSIDEPHVNTTTPITNKNEQNKNFPAHSLEKKRSSLENMNSIIKENKKVTKIPPPIKERKKLRRSSANDKVRKYSVGAMLFENFAMNDINNNIGDCEKDTKEEERNRSHSWTKRELFRSSFKKEKPHIIKKISKNFIETFETEKVTENEKTETRNVSLTEAKMKNDTTTNKDDIYNGISPTLSPLLRPKTQSSLKNTNRVTDVVSENPLENWNALMLSPGYDFSRILSKGRPEKRSARSKITSIFKQKIMETVE